MKQKKRKQKRPELAANSSRVGAGWRAPPWLPPAAGAAAMLACFAAMLGGISGGHPGLHALFSVDSAYSYDVFHDIFLADVDISGFRLSTSPMLFPDMLLFAWPFYALGVGWFPGMYVVALMQTVFGAAGWILVCARLGGGWEARSAVLLAWSAPLLGMSYGMEVFAAQAHTVLHFGAWICAPWLLWLALPRGDAAKKGGSEASTPRLAALALALAICIGSDLLIVTWFVAPAAAAAAILFLRGRWNAPRTGKFLAALAIGSLGGGLVRKLTLSVFTPSIFGEEFTSFHPERVWWTIQAIANFFSLTARAYPLMAVVWLAFASLAAVRLREALSAKNREPDARVFAAIFLPAAIVMPLLAVAAVGNYGAPGDTIRLWVNLRYFIPVVFVPLFVGWTIPPLWNFFPRILAGRERLAVVALAGILAVAAAPKIAAIDSELLSPYNTPFHRCVSEAAKERGWRAGIGSVFGMSELVIDPDNGVERKLTVQDPRYDGEQYRSDPLWVEWTITNRHWFNGEFDFAVVNFHDGRYFSYPPDPLALSYCDARTWPGCGRNRHAISEEIVRSTFGEPSETLECAGLKILAYDPPVRVDMSAVPDWGYATPIKVLPRER